MRQDLDAILKENKADAIFLYGDSVKNVNMFYLSRFLAPDPFIIIKETDSQPTMIVNSMEYPRAKKEAIIKNVKSYVDYNMLEIIKAAKEPRQGLLNFLVTVAQKDLGKEKTICVPYNFPAIILDAFRNESLKVKPMFDIVEKARETKEADEIAQIKKVQEAMEKATAEAISTIANSETNSKNILVHKENGKKKPLTAGKIRMIIAQKLLEHGCITEEEIIVACGPAGADPHYAGMPQDVLKANQPIILDVFAKGMRERYLSDMTRTIVKGKASKDVKKMFETVLEAKNACIDALHEGVLGSDMYNLCCNILEKAGYETSRGGKQIEKGFTHGLGHGVGLEIHEGPSMNEVYKFPLKEHNIVTVEPGLYDPKIGGVRIEDIVEIRKTGCNNLTKMEIMLEV
ncbi:MAG: Xaa-Pro peptidase family protein [Candidatus Bathyarchaeia archaeon]